MKAKALELAPAYYKNYIELAPDAPLTTILQTGGISLYENELEKLERIGDKVYAKGKWTVKEMVQHCIDTERIFLNRALRFARKDKTPLPGYEQDDYVPLARVNERTLADLIEEYNVVRQGSYYFFKHLSDDELLRTGNASGVEISVLSIGFILVGHPTHHFNVLQNLYLDL